MAQAILDQMIHQLNRLKIEELQTLSQAIQQRLSASDTATQRDNFHRALLSSGLVKQIKPTSGRKKAERHRILITGKPVSETILEERH